MFASSNYSRLLWVKSHPKHEDMVIILIGGDGGGTGRLVVRGGIGGADSGNPFLVQRADTRLHCHGI